MYEFIRKTWGQIARKVFSIWDTHDKQAVVANHSNQLGTGGMQVKYMLENVGAYHKIEQTIGIRHVFDTRETYIDASTLSVFEITRADIHPVTQKLWKLREQSSQTASDIEYSAPLCSITA